MDARTVTDYAELITVLRHRLFVDAATTLANVDSMTGCPDRYLGKCLGPNASRNLSVRLLLDVCKALGLRIRIEPDSQLARMMARSDWQGTAYRRATPNSSQPSA